MFHYNADYTLSEQTNGPAGNYTGTGYWLQFDQYILLMHFIEPIAHTNLEVIVYETGVVTSDGNTMTQITKTP